MSEEFPTQDGTTSGGDNDGDQGVAGKKDDQDAEFDASKLVEGPGGVMITEEERRNWDHK